MFKYLGHKRKRKNFRWLSNTHVPIRERYLCDISDVHLANIIKWVLDRKWQYNKKIIKTILVEAEYRINFNITVPEYKEEFKPRTELKYHDY